MTTNQSNWHRTHNLGALRKENVEEKVILSGWVQSHRNLGGLTFVDLRDREGVTQIVFDPEVSENAHKVASDLRNEFVLTIKGTVKPRLEGQANKNMPTGEIEVLVTEAQLVNRAEPLPFQINDDVEANETTLLKYRYLDLRRNQVKSKLMKRIEFVKEMRRALEDKGFLDIETPYLYKSTPEGAREFLVPSRIHEGQFYALPQSPQLFKQVLMVAGFDKYYQVVKCFRDEDLRADRQPEFTQIDCEMSFVDQEKILNTFEEIVTGVFKKVTKVALPEFPRMTFQDAMENYGNDKPDTRFELKLQNLSEVVKGCGFKVFDGPLESGGIVNALCVKNAADSFSRKDIDAMTDLVKKYGAKGLAWAKVKSGSGVESWQSPVAKFLSDDTIDAIKTKLQAQENDLILFGAGDYDSTKASLSALRLYLGKRLELFDKNQFNFLWVVDFPLMEKDEESGRYVACHHPFTSPKAEDLHMLDSEPHKCRANAYDLVLNGNEVAGGSIRIHDQELQSRVFKAIGLTEDEAQEKFGFLLEALKFGAPPHGGMAFGLDRLAMLITGAETIKDVIAFPKTNKAACLMTQSPNEVTDKELKDLHIRLEKSEK